MSKNRETLLDVMGMSCPSCIRHINDALAELEGITSIDVRLRDGKVAILHDPATAPIDSMIEALREAGYESSPSAAA